MSRRAVTALTRLNTAVSRPRLARSATQQKRVYLPHTERNERGGDEPRTARSVKSTSKEFEDSP
ncbi:MAG: hypothetical protein OSJ39_03285 [Clostridia bacterium]|nr:hypothetical protein [Clostridia bacterium]